jgi:hypothetical protein
MAKDNTEHHTSGVYEKFCKPRFEGIEEDIKDTQTTVHNIDKVVNDGLKDKTERLEKHSNWIIGLLISLLFIIIASTIGLYATNQNKVEQVNEKVERLLNDN